MRSHKRSSRSNPSQLAEVPFQAITSTLASARSSAARRISLSSNCASDCWDRAISVTRNREKCAVTSGSSDSIAKVTGSSTVFDEGVSIPRRMLPVTILGPSPGSSDLGVDPLAGPLSGTGCRAVRYVPLVRGRAEPRGSSERWIMDCGCAVRARLLAPDTDPLGLGVVLGGDELRRGGRGRPSAAVEKDDLGEVSPLDLAAVEIGRTGRKASDLAAVQVAREVLDLPAL